MQLLEQFISPVAHWQELVAPLEVHSWPLEHLVPQLPQLFGSIEAFTHCVPQLSAPAWHAQLPETQALPTAQETPHAPQLALLLLSVTHWPPQTACPAGQEPARAGGEALQASGRTRAKMQARIKPRTRFIASLGWHDRLPCRQLRSAAR